MKNNKTIKILFTILMMIIILFMFIANVSALDPADYMNPSHTANTTEIKNVGQKIFTLVRIVGITASVVVLVVIGIKYMMGSAEEKSEYKKTMLPYVIGALFIFSASVIAQIIYNVFSTVSL